MCEWVSTVFGEVARRYVDIVNPADIPPDTPYIGLEHIEPGTLRLSSWGIACDTISSKLRFDVGDVIYGKLRPYFRKVCRPARSGVCTTEAWVLRPATGVDSRYLFYLTATPAFSEFATRASDGTRMPRAQWTHVASYPVLLPPLSEQRAIAEVLGALDDKIEANRRMRQILMELLDLSYIASVEACAEQSVPMGELVELALGGVWGSDEPQSPDDIRVNCLRGVDLANVANGVRPLPPVRWLSRTQFEKREYTEGEIWVEGSGSFCGRSLLVGHYLDNLFEGPIRYSNFVKRLVPRRSSSLATVAWLSLRYAYRSGEISAWRTGSAFPNINVEALLRHVVKVPPSAVVDDMAVLAKVALDPAPLLESVRLASLRDTLLPKLMSGELRVRDAEPLVEEFV